MVRGGRSLWRNSDDIRGFLPPGDLPNPGIEPRSPALQADSLPSEPPGKPNKVGTSTYFPYFIGKNTKAQRGHVTC